MRNRYWVRPENKERFKECVRLRKLGFSYSEITKKTGIAQSTLNNWFTLAGLIFKQEHFETQAKTRLENYYDLGVEASRIGRKQRRERQISQTIQKLRSYFNDPLLVTGIMLYEAEGAKEGSCRFSNSDYRLVLTFIKFIEKYFKLTKEKDITFSLYIHKTRKLDANRVKQFWLKKLKTSPDKIKVRWKTNKILRRRKNMDYVGQIDMRVGGEAYLVRKLLSISGIILQKYTHKIR